MKKFKINDKFQLKWLEHKLSERRLNTINNLSKFMWIRDWENL